MTLHCEVDSNPPSKITWMFGEQELSQDTAANLSLSLDDVSPAQEGVYTCVGDNGYGIMNTSLFLAVKCEFLRRAMLTGSHQLSDPIEVETD